MKLRWYLSRHSLPSKADGLTARAEMLYYLLLWCQVNGRPPPPLKKIARDLRSFAGTISKDIERLHNLRLIDAEKYCDFWSHPLRSARRKPDHWKFLSRMDISVRALRPAA